jgi:hypothetical protein
MALIDAVKTACDRLATLGWRDLLLRVTGDQLDIRQPTAAKLRDALQTPLTVVDRGFTGFGDFAPDAKQGITPGLPGRSLLYHAFASPGVSTGVDGPLRGFPTLREIEAVEHVTFGIEPPTLAALATRAALARGEKLTPVVFAYEYRPARDTCARTHADLAFSRTGIARVGTQNGLYSPERRGFEPEDGADPFAFRVCPARYGVFRAVPRKGAVATAVPMRRQQGDQNRKFWVPVHKLFDGDECLAGLTLTLQFKSFHYNDKIRRIQVLLGATPPAGPPFQITDHIATFAASSRFPRRWMPVPHPRLVEPARRNGTFVTYRVPPAESGFAAFEPGADIDETTGAEVRPAPATCTRTEVRDGILIDPAPTRRARMSSPTCQRATTTRSTMSTSPAKVRSMPSSVDWRPARSWTSRSGRPSPLVAAPDFPSAGQREMTEWARSPEVPPALRGRIWGIDPVALCDTRLPANLQMPASRFDANETTISAVVPQLGSVAAGTTAPASTDAFRHSCLPDDAAGVCARLGREHRQTTRGAATHITSPRMALGSPFPEDSKLCAALSTFWPAVAPDITRSLSTSTGNTSCATLWRRPPHPCRRRRGRAGPESRPSAGRGRAPGRT